MMTYDRLIRFGRIQRFVDWPSLVAYLSDTLGSLTSEELETTLSNAGLGRILSDLCTEAGCDIGFERALIDWILRYRSAWRERRKDEIVRSVANEMTL